MKSYKQYNTIGCRRLMDIYWKFSDTWDDFRHL